MKAGPPCVLLVEEKHATRYFHIDSTGELHRVALGILTERQKLGYWYTAADPPKTPEYTEATLDTVPKSLQNIARAALASYKRLRADYDKEIQAQARIVKAIETKDGKDAWAILDSRKDYEYESVQLIAYATI